MSDPDDYDYEPDQLDPEDGEEDGSDCGAWFNGKFDYYHCTQAGTEYCDWDCPFADEGRRALVAQIRGDPS